MPTSCTTPIGKLLLSLRDESYVRTRPLFPRNFRYVLSTEKAQANSCLLMFANFALNFKGHEKQNVFVNIGYYRPTLEYPYFGGYKLAAK